MKTTVNFNNFKQAFVDYDRAEQFTPEGLKALFEDLENYEIETDSEIELDVIALCCEFSEYANLDELKENYTSIDTLDDLYDNTRVIEFDGGIIISNF